MLDLEMTMTPDSGDVVFRVRVAGTEDWDELHLIGGKLMGDDVTTWDKPVMEFSMTYKTKKSTLIAKVYDWLDSQDRYDI